MLSLDDVSEIERCRDHVSAYDLSHASLNRLQLYFRVRVESVGSNTLR